MNKRSLILASTLAMLVLLAVTVSLTLAQGSDQPQGPTAVVPGAIPVQGRLTDAGGSPLNGTYTMTFRLYETDTGGASLCADTNSVTVQNGLFTSWIDYCYNGVLWGQKVWFSVQMQGESEMTPRQVIYPVPYALGLVPGVVISASHANPFSVKTTSASGTAVEGIASSSTGINYGVYGASNSPNGYAGYFYNYGSGAGVSSISVAGTAIVAGSLGGPAIRTSSATGTALALEGTGRLTSTAKSYVWISGSDVRAYNQADTTVINMDSIGGAKISSGSAGDKNVVLPITVPGELYGQDVRVTGLDIHWVGETSFDAISVVLMRRQTGVCPTCYVNILNDGADHVCDISNNATGCTQSYTLSTNNTLSSSSGVLYLTLQLAFNSTSSYIELGGVRLTLEHD